MIGKRKKITLITIIVSILLLMAGCTNEEVMSQGLNSSLNNIMASINIEMKVYLYKTFFILKVTNPTIFICSMAVATIILVAIPNEKEIRKLTILWGICLIPFLCVLSYYGLALYLTTYMPPNM